MIYSREDLDKTVCNIRTPGEGAENIGTGIFISKSDEEIYLLTAAHVISKINPRTYVVLMGVRGNPIEVLLSTILGGSNFDLHPVADLAKARINISERNIHFLKDRFFPYDHIDMSTDLLSKDIELTTVGFPFGLGAKGAKFTPLSFRSYVAASAISLIRFDIFTPCDFIILELPSIGGYSGGPVFDLGYIIVGLMRHKKEKTHLHGIVHGVISDPKGGKLAAITPLKYLDGWL